MSILSTARMDRYQLVPVLDDDDDDDDFEANADFWNDCGAAIFADQLDPNDMGGGRFSRNSYRPEDDSADTSTDVNDVNQPGRLPSTFGYASDDYSADAVINEDNKVLSGFYHVTDVVDKMSHGNQRPTSGVDLQTFRPFGTSPQHPSASQSSSSTSGMVSFLRSSGLPPPPLPSMQLPHPVFDIRLANAAYFDDSDSSDDGAPRGMGGRTLDTISEEDENEVLQELADLDDDALRVDTASVSPSGRNGRSPVVGGFRSVRLCSSGSDDESWRYRKGSQSDVDPDRDSSFGEMEDMQLNSNGSIVFSSYNRQRDNNFVVVVVDSVNSERNAQHDRLPTPDGAVCQDRDDRTSPCELLRSAADSSSSSGHFNLSPLRGVTYNLRSPACSSTVDFVPVTPELDALPRPTTDSNQLVDALTSPDHVIVSVNDVEFRKMNDALENDVIDDETDANVVRYSSSISLIESRLHFSETVSIEGTTPETNCDFERHIGFAQAEVLCESRPALPVTSPIDAECRSTAVLSEEWNVNSELDVRQRIELSLVPSSRCNSLDNKSEIRNDNRVSFVSETTVLPDLQPMQIFEQLRKHKKLNDFYGDLTSEAAPNSGDAIDVDSTPSPVVMPLLTSTPLQSLDWVDVISGWEVAQNGQNGELSDEETGFSASFGCRDCQQTTLYRHDNESDNVRCPESTETGKEHSNDLPRAAGEQFEDLHDRRPLLDAVAAAGPSDRSVDDSANNGRLLLNAYITTDSGLLSNGENSPLSGQTQPPASPYSHSPQPPQQHFSQLPDEEHSRRNAPNDSGVLPEAEVRLNYEQNCADGLPSRPSSLDLTSDIVATSPGHLASFTENTCVDAAGVNLLNGQLTNGVTGALPTACTNESDSCRSVLSTEFDILDTESFEIVCPRLTNDACTFPKAASIAHDSSVRSSVLSGGLINEDIGNCSELKKPARGHGSKIVQVEEETETVICQVVAVRISSHENGQSLASAKAQDHQAVGDLLTNASNLTTAVEDQTDLNRPTSSNQHDSELHLKQQAAVLPLNQGVASLTENSESDNKIKGNRIADVVSAEKEDNSRIQQKQSLPAASSKSTRKKRYKFCMVDIDIDGDGKEIQSDAQTHKVTPTRKSCVDNPENHRRLDEMKQRIFNSRPVAPASSIDEEQWNSEVAKAYSSAPMSRASSTYCSSENIWSATPEGDDDDSVRRTKSLQSLIFGRRNRGLNDSTSSIPAEVLSAQGGTGSSSSNARTWQRSHATNDDDDKSERTKSLTDLRSADEKKLLLYNFTSTTDVSDERNEVRPTSDWKSAGESGRCLSKNELLLRQSVENLDLPDWCKNSPRIQQEIVILKNVRSHDLCETEILEKPSSVASKTSQRLPDRPSSIDELSSRPSIVMFHMVSKPMTSSAAVRTNAVPDNGRYQLPSDKLRRKFGPAVYSPIKIEPFDQLIRPVLSNNSDSYVNEVSTMTGRNTVSTKSGEESASLDSKTEANTANISTIPHDRQAINSQNLSKNAVNLQDERMAENGLTNSVGQTVNKCQSETTANSVDQTAVITTAQMSAVVSNYTSSGTTDVNIESKSTKCQQHGVASSPATLSVASRHADDFVAGAPLPDCQDVERNRPQALDFIDDCLSEEEEHFGGRPQVIEQTGGTVSNNNIKSSLTVMSIDVNTERESPAQQQHQSSDQQTTNDDVITREVSDNDSEIDSLLPGNIQNSENFDYRWGKGEKNFDYETLSPTNFNDLRSPRDGTRRDSTEFVWTIQQDDFVAYKHAVDQQHISRSDTSDELYERETVNLRDDRRIPEVVADVVGENASEADYYDAQQFKDGVADDGTENDDNELDVSGTENEQDVRGVLKTKETNADSEESQSETSICNNIDEILPPITDRHDQHSKSADIAIHISVCSSPSFTDHTEQDDSVETELNETLRSANSAEITMESHPLNSDFNPFDLTSCPGVGQNLSLQANGHDVTASEKIGAIHSDDVDPKAGDDVTDLNQTATQKAGNPEVVHSPPDSNSLVDIESVCYPGPADTSQNPGKTELPPVVGTENGLINADTDCKSCLLEQESLFGSGEDNTVSTLERETDNQLANLNESSTPLSRLGEDEIRSFTIADAGAGHSSNVVSEDIAAIKSLITTILSCQLDRRRQVAAACESTVDNDTKGASPPGFVNNRLTGSESVSVTVQHDNVRQTCLSDKQRNVVKQQRRRAKRTTTTAPSNGSPRHSQTRLVTKPKSRDMASSSSSTMDSAIRYEEDSTLSKRNQTTDFFPATTCSSEPPSVTINRRRNLSLVGNGLTAAAPTGSASDADCENLASRHLLSLEIATFFNKNNHNGDESTKRATINSVSSTETICSTKSGKYNVKSASAQHRLSTTSATSATVPTVPTDRGNTSDAVSPEVLDCRIVVRNAKERPKAATSTGNGSHREGESNVRKLTERFKNLDRLPLKPEVGRASKHSGRYDSLLFPHQQQQLVGVADIAICDGMLRVQGAIPNSLNTSHRLSEGIPSEPIPRSVKAVPDSNGNNADQRVERVDRAKNQRPRNDGIDRETMSNSNHKPVSSSLENLVDRLLFLPVPTGNASDVAAVTPDRKLRKILRVLRKASELRMQERSRSLQRSTDSFNPSDSGPPTRKVDSLQVRSKNSPSKFDRLSDDCKQILRRVRDDTHTRSHLATIAANGFRSHGRGCVVLAFDDRTRLKAFLDSGSSSQAENETKNDSTICFVGVDQLLQAAPATSGSELHQLCNAYSPVTSFVACSAVIDKSDSTSGCFRCVKLHLSSQSSNGFASSASLPLASKPQPKNIDTSPVPETLILTSVPGADKLPTEPDVDKESRRRLREVSFANLQRRLRQRGVSLRRQYPDVYAALCDHVTDDRSFAPVSIFPVDTKTGRRFMCVIMPDSEPEISWMDDDVDKNKFNGNLTLENCDKVNLSATSTEFPVVTVPKATVV